MQLHSSLAPPAARALASVHDRTWPSGLSRLSLSLDSTPGCAAAEEPPCHPSLSIMDDAVAISRGSDKGAGGGSEGVNATPPTWVTCSDLSLVLRKLYMRGYHVRIGRL